MRDIKFRAWHPATKSFIDWETIKHYHSMHFIFDYGEIELNQYTGLKDRNDKEIYESDIVKIIAYDGDNEQICAVEENDGVLTVNIDQLEIDEDGDYTAIGWLKHYGSTTTNIEVIGNIYENPELLEVDKSVHSA